MSKVVRSNEFFIKKKIYRLDSMKTLFTVIGLLIFFNSYSQDNLKKINYGISLQGVYPLTKNFFDNYSAGVGGNFHVQYSLNKDYDLTAKVGYIRFGGRTKQDIYFKYRTKPVQPIPIKLGIKYNITEYFYIGGEGGVSINALKGDVLTISPSVGIRLKRITFSIQASNWIYDDENYAFVGFNIGFLSNRK